MDKKEKLSIKATAGNVVFVAKYLYSISKMLYLLRFMLMAAQISSVLLAAFSVSYVLNQITDVEANYNQVLAAILLFAGGNFALSMLKRFISIQNHRKTEIVLYQIKLNLGETVAQLQYSDVEDSRVRDFISLASSSDSFSKLIDQFTNLISAVVSGFTYAVIVLYGQPMILILIVAVVAVQTLVCRLRVQNQMKWRAVQSPLFRKLDYLHHVFSRPQYGQEMRINNL